MTTIILQECFKAGSQIAEEQLILSVSKTAQENVWRGEAKLPPANLQKEILIYKAQTPEGEVIYRAIPAKCPHQGANLSDDPLKPDGNVYCHLHRRPICVFSEYNFAFDVRRNLDQFYLVTQ